MASKALNQNRNFKKLAKTAVYLLCSVGRSRMLGQSWYSCCGLLVAQVRQFQVFLAQYWQVVSRVFHMFLLLAVHMSYLEAMFFSWVSEALGKQL